MPPRKTMSTALRLAAGCGSKLCAVEISVLGGRDMTVEIVADQLNLNPQVFNGQLPVSLRRNKMNGRFKF